MQISSLLTEKSRKLNFISRARTSGGVIKDLILNYPNKFIFSFLDSRIKPAPKFNMRGFFLESTIDTKIKSVPIFIFSLQRHESMETFISCFYADNCPTLFENLSSVSSSSDNSVFFFNWFAHETIAPVYPPHRDEISNVFYNTKEEFLGYRIFDLTYAEAFWAQQFSHFTRLYPRISLRGRFIKKTRFYKRNYSGLMGFLRRARKKKLQCK